MIYVCMICMWGIYGVFMQCVWCVYGICVVYVYMHMCVCGMCVCEYGIPMLSVCV